MSPTPSRPRRAVLALLLAPLVGLRSAQAQPKSDLDLIVPNPAGGSADEVAKIVAAALLEIGGTTVNLVYVTGGSGVDGTAAIAASPPDGKVLGMAISAAMVSAKLVSRVARYDPLKDFDWLAIFGTYPNALVISAALPVHTLQEWIEFARKAPAPLRFGTFGRGSAGHLAGGFLRSTEHLNLEHVPIAVMDQAYPRLSDGTLDVLFDGVPNAIGNVPGGRYRAIGVTSAARVAALPDAVAFGEIWKGRAFEVWVGLVAPKGMPVAAYSELAANLGVMCNDPKYIARFRQAGMIFLGYTGKTAREYIETDYIRTARMIADFGIEPDR